MHLLIAGAGLMGPAAAVEAISHTSVDRVTLLDRDLETLAYARGIIERALDYRDIGTWEKETGPLRRGDQALLLRVEHPAKYPFETIQVDLDDIESAATVFGEADVILSALPWSATRRAIEAARKAGRPLVDLAIPDDAEMAALKGELGVNDPLILLGCGLEPGLTEIETLRLARKLDSVDHVRIMVGGVPSIPSGPLGYKIVFGGTELPLRPSPALVVESGELVERPRYSAIEPAPFAGIGLLEAWHEGVIPWMLEREELQGVQSIAQKTIRWPGYGVQAGVLDRLGLLGTEPVDVDGTEIVPKRLVDELLRNEVTFGPDDRDITLFRVEVEGRLHGERKIFRTEMVDRFDEQSGLTSMARTTAFTGSILARMIGKGMLGSYGLRTPDEILTPDLTDHLFAELAACGVHFRTDSYGPIDTLLDSTGRLRSIPSKESTRHNAIAWIASHFAPGTDYLEEEVDHLIESLHTFGDTPWIRRELIEGGWMGREEDGSRYWRVRSS